MFFGQKVKLFLFFSLSTFILTRTKKIPIRNKPLSVHRHEHLNPNIEESRSAQADESPSAQADDALEAHAIKPDGAHGDKSHGARADKPRGAHADKSRGAKSDKPRGAHADRHRGTDDDEPRGAHADKPRGAHANKHRHTDDDEPRGAHADKPRGAQTNKPRGAQSDKPRGAHGDKPRGAHGDKPPGAHGDKPRGAHGDKPSGAQANEPLGAQSFEALVALADRNDDMSIIEADSDDGYVAHHNTKSEEFRYLKRFNWTIHCKFQKNERVCSTNEKTVRRFYFDMHMQRCERFTFGHCKDNFNMFSARKSCQEECQDAAFAKHYQPNLTANIFCRFQPEFGDCSSYFPSFYFDITQQMCKGFSYSGCGGNRNRFTNPRDCLATCGIDTVISLDPVLTFNPHI